MKMNSSTKNDGEVKKFLFDNNDFDRVAPEPPPPAETFSADQLALAKSQGHAQGRAEGLREANASIEDAQTKALQNIVAALGKLTAAEDRRDIESMINATRLAMKVTHKLLPQFAQRFSLQEIERVILDSVEARREEPRIAVIVSGQHLDALKQHIETLAAEKGYAGKMIIVADDNLAPTDVRVEWADGGAERLYERLYSQIETEFAKAIAGMQSTLNDKN